MKKTKVEEPMLLLQPIPAVNLFLTEKQARELLSDVVKGLMQLEQAKSTRKMNFISQQQQVAKTKNRTSKRK